MTEYVIKNPKGGIVCRVEAGSGDAAVKRARDAGYEVHTGFTIQAIGGKQHDII